MTSMQDAGKAPPQSQDTDSLLKRLAGPSTTKAGSVLSVVDVVWELMGPLPGLRKIRPISTVSLQKHPKVPNSTR